jgi:tetraacyldisaccharide 4'-kinase
VLNPAEFRDLVSGRRRGPGAALARAGLRLVEAPYAAAMHWRNWRYDRRRAEIVRVEVPVISIGNLTLGGTGKTPCVEWVARWYRARGVRVALVSRGYGAVDRHRNDEALELEQRLPDVPHVQDADRVAAARVAIDELQCQLIVADDAFQHRRLARDLDVVLLDALEPFGYGHVFPRGLLREPAAGLHRANAILLSRADAVSADRRAEIRGQAQWLAPGVPWCEVAHAPRGLLSCDMREAPLTELAGRRVAAFCGLGNPAGFRHTLERAGCDVAAWREFPDHHGYTREDVHDLVRWADAVDVAAVVTTHKDLVKVALDALGRRPLWALTIGVEFQAGQDVFEGLLAALIPAADAS